jgi:hypothetical protein
MGRNIEPDLLPPSRPAARTICPSKLVSLGTSPLDPSMPASTRVRAAKCVLAHAAKAIEIEDVEARVSELERAAEETSRKR